MRISRILAGAVLVWLLGSNCLAAAATTTPINAEFRILSFGSDLSGLFISNGGRYQALSATANRIMGNYRYTGPATMALYRPAPPSRDGRGAGGREEMLPAGTVTFANGSGRYILVLKQSGDTYTGTAIPDSAQSVPPGDLRLINATGLPLTIEVTGKTLPMRAGEVRIHNVPRDNRRCDLHVYITREGQPIEIANSVFAFATDVKCTVFLILSNAEALRANPSTYPMIDIMPFHEGQRPPQPSTRRGPGEE